MNIEKIEDLRILAVDDERITLSRIKNMLNKLGIDQVVTMGSTSEALTFITEQGDAIDVVLVDMFMPENDGVDLIIGLKTIGFQGCIAIISGGDDRVLAGAEVLARAKDVEILGTLKKPVSADDLKALLSKVISPAA